MRAPHAVATDSVMPRATIAAIAVYGLASLRGFTVGRKELIGRDSAVRSLLIQDHHRRRQETGDVLDGITEPRALPIDQHQSVTRAHEVARSTIGVYQRRSTYLGGRHLDGSRRHQCLGGDRRHGRHHLVRVITRLCG